MRQIIIINKTSNYFSSIKKKSLNFAEVVIIYYKIQYINMKNILKFLIISINNGISFNLLGDMKLNIQREEKQRQLLWERSPELRELRQKFLLANVTRDQVMQMAEKQALAELRRLEEIALAEEEMRRSKELEAEERRKEVEEFQAKLKYHRDLDELRRFKVLARESSGSEKEMERNAIDEILKKIQQENLEAEQRRIEVTCFLIKKIFILTIY